MVCQHFILYLMFNNIRRASVSEGAVLIGVSKMSISKAFDELEAMQLPIRKECNSRYFHWDLDWGTLLRNTLPRMSSPIRREYRLAEAVDVRDGCLSGISMMAEKTQLGDNDYQTIAIDKKSDEIKRIDGAEVVPSFEKPQQIVTVVNYLIRYKGEPSVDPVSAWLSLPENYPTDARVRYETGRLFAKVVDGWDPSWPLI